MSILRNIFKELFLTLGGPAVFNLLFFLRKTSTFQG